MILEPDMEDLQLGAIVATPGALEVLEGSGEDTTSLLDRHKRGDWGDLGEEDREQNMVARKHGLLVFSAYTIGKPYNKQKVWIITEADRSVTTVLLPADY